MKFPKFEELLVEWLWAMDEQNKCAINELIRGEDKRILENLNENNPENEKRN